MLDAVLCADSDAGNFFGFGADLAGVASRTRAWIGDGRAGRPAPDEPQRRRVAAGGARASADELRQLAARDRAAEEAGCGRLADPRRGPPSPAAGRSSPGLLNLLDLGAGGRCYHRGRVAVGADCVGRGGGRDAVAACDWSRRVRRRRPGRSPARSRSWPHSSRSRCWPPAATCPAPAAWPGDRLGQAGDEALRLHRLHQGRGGQRLHGRHRLRRDPARSPSPSTTTSSRSTSRSSSTVTRCASASRICGSTETSR